MPSQSKKPAAKQTTTRKRTTTHQRRRSAAVETGSIKKSLYIVLGVLLMISMVAFGYYLGQENCTKRQKVITQYVMKPATKEPVLPKPMPSVQVKIKPKQVVLPSFTPPKRLPPKVKIAEDTMVKLVSHQGKPRLVIIIDDVSTQKQLQHIHALHMKITPSIFPPFKGAMQSNTLAYGLRHYMIHLPMESGNAKFNRQYKTLKCSFSNGEIEERVKEIRRLFPTGKYINNHTGSVFTSDYRAMLTLYQALKKEGFIFMDSRTSSATKVPKIAKEMKDVYIARDIFIDNVQRVSSIHQQLKKAVLIAKKRGYAVAIGHPHTVTLRALGEATGILKGVELVYIDQLMTI